MEEVLNLTIASVPAVKHILHFPLHLVFDLDGFWLWHVITCSLPVQLKQGDVEDVMNESQMFPKLELVGPLAHHIGDVEGSMELPVQLLAQPSCGDVGS